MKRKNITRIITSLILTFCVIVATTACASQNVSSPPADVSGYRVKIENAEHFCEQPKSIYNAGEEVIIKTEILCDAALEVFVDGESIGTGKPVKTGENYTHNEYRFTMPSHNVTVTARTEPNFSQKPSMPENMPESFSFKFTWNCYGTSFYDSSTGILIKDTHNTEKYTATYFLSQKELSRIYALIQKLEIENYPDSYDPHDGKLASDPSLTLSISVRAGTFQKTVTAANIAYAFNADNDEGQAFLDVCNEIITVLTATDEWNSLPEYEFFYQ